MNAVKVTEASYVSIGLAIMAAAGILSAAFFIAGLSYASAQHGKEIAEIKAHIEDRRKASSQYEQTIALQMAGIKADVSIVDTRMTYLTDVVLRAIEQRAEHHGALKKGKTQ